MPSIVNLTKTLLGAALLSMALPKIWKTTKNSALRSFKYLSSHVPLFDTLCKSFLKDLKTIQKNKYHIAMALLIVGFIAFSNRKSPSESLRSPIRMGEFTVHLHPPVRQAPLLPVAVVAIPSQQVAIEAHRQTMYSQFLIELCSVYDSMEKGEIPISYDVPDVTQIARTVNCQQGTLDYTAFDWIQKDRRLIVNGYTFTLAELETLIIEEQNFRNPFDNKVWDAEELQKIQQALAYKAILEGPPLEVDTLMKKQVVKTLREIVDLIFNEEFPCNVLNYDEASTLTLYRKRLDPISPHLLPQTLFNGLPFDAVMIKLITSRHNEEVHLNRNEVAQYLLEHITQLEESP